MNMSDLVCEPSWKRLMFKKMSIFTIPMYNYLEIQSFVMDQITDLASSIYNPQY